MNKKITRLAIANRGEVAVRIIRACEELGIETVLLHSEADMQTRAYRMANKKICIGPAASTESYLNAEANIQGALAGGAQAIHPGFGFLSENANFAQACIDAGLIFVGPSPQAIRTLGDKVHCKELAKKLGLPLVPGYQGEDQSVDHLILEAEKIGYPVIVKAAAGGGGRGMKVIQNSNQAKELIESAQRECLSAFGSSKIFLEKYLDRAKHIEFQIFGDASGKVRHLFDRECSVQRRHQKIIEEALSPSISSELRRKMGEAACVITQSAKYQGAGTVEFLFQDDEFYLLEVNTRLQVEHPVTEMVLGVDLVKAQIMTAQGEATFLNDIFSAHGHAIECRIYAENSYQAAVPSTGLLGKVSFPEGPGRRFEYGFEEGDTITSFYDPMIAKVIVWDESRPRAIQKMVRVLKDTVIFGVHTNIPYLLEILSHPDFVNGRMTTRFIDKYFSESLERPEFTELEIRAGREALRILSPALSSPDSEVTNIESPWLSSWRGI
jgi:3-methylcrotonyl-CoA carboxylase alpha subunit